MKFLFKLIKNLISKLLFFGIVAYGTIFFWNMYKEKREARTFVTSFQDIEGLRKGAPVFSNGVQVGKVIRIFPLGNTGHIGVKSAITNKNYPAPRSAVNARIVTNYESGGGKILEVSNLFVGHDEAAIKRLSKDNNKSQVPYLMRNATRLMRDFFQLSKDWAIDTSRALNSSRVQEYQENVALALENTVTSFEYGTVKQDIKNSINRLNHDLKEIEQQPNKAAKAQRAMENQAKALQNTVKTYGSLADVYK
jgi:hypothetical protein